MRKSCGPCIALKAKCNHERPCDRCLKRGVSCNDVERKSRSKKEMPINKQQRKTEFQFTTHIHPLKLLQMNITNKQKHISPDQVLEILFPGNNINNINNNNSNYITNNIPNNVTSINDSVNNNIHTFDNILSSNNSPLPNPLSLSLSLPTEQEITINQLDDELSFTNDNCNIILENEFYDNNNNANNPNDNANNINSFYPVSPSQSSLSPEYSSSSSSSSSSPSPYSSPSSLFISPSPSLSPPQSPTIGFPLNNTVSAEQALSPHISTLHSLLGVISHTTGENSKKKKTNEEVFCEIESMKVHLHSLVECMEKYMPKEVVIPKGVAIINPSQLIVRDCNESFADFLGFPQDYLRNRRICLPFYVPILERDVEYLKRNNITCGERYIALQHKSGGVAYALGYFQMVSSEHVIMTVVQIYQDTPHCLKVAFDHYLGLTSVHRAPTKPCEIQYCHCKLLHLPLLQNNT